MLCRGLGAQASHAQQQGEAAGGRGTEPCSPEDARGLVMLQPLLRARRVR